MEPPQEKTCHCSFRSGQTQTRLYNHKKMARGLKFQIQDVEELYYQCRANKGADQL